MIERRKLMGIGLLVATVLFVVTAAALIITLSSEGDNEWTYPDITHDEYRAAGGPRPQLTAGDLAALVDPQDPHVLEIAAHMSSPQDVLDFVSLKIAPSKDIDLYGARDHWASPVETLFNRQGDCEDSAILMASILRAMGYEPELVIFTAEPKGHVAVMLYGILMDRFAVHGQPPINADLTSSIIGVKLLAKGKIEQRMIEKLEIFK